MPGYLDGANKFYVATVLGIAAICIVYFSTLQSLVHSWASDSTFSHGFLILPIAAYLGWIRRDRISLVESRPTFWGVPIMLLLSLVWAVGWAGNIRVVEQFAFVGALIVTLVAIWGFGVARKLAFPLSYLIFLVPFGDSLVQPLRNFTARFAVTGLELLRIPVLYEGHTIILTTGNWEVADACSGLRFMIAAVAFTVSLWGILQTWKHRLALLGIAAVTAIIGNGFRALGIILLGHFTNNRIAAGIDHVIYGWIFISVLMMGFLWIAFRWAKKERAEGMGRPGSGEVVIEYPVARGAAVLASVIVAALLVPFFVANSKGRAATNPTPEFRTNSSWVLLPMPSTGGWMPKQPNAEAVHEVRYMDGQHWVDVHVAYASVASGGITPVSMWNVEGDQFWNADGIKVREATIDGKKVQINESDLALGVRARRVWNFYFINGEFTGSNTRLKFLQARARLAGTNPSVALVSLGTESDSPDRVLQQWLDSTTLARALTGASRN